MKCTSCGTDLTGEMFAAGMCFSCGCPISESEKAFEAEQSKIKADEALAAQKCKEDDLRKAEEAQKLYDKRLKTHMLTTGFSFEGYRIDKYFGIVTGETIVGTGYFSELDASISDFFGAEATEYSEKLRTAKKNVLNAMIKNSADLGGNAIIGVSYELMTFSGKNMIGVSATGTSVRIEENPLSTKNENCDT